MSNIWAAIACHAPCMVRQSQARPLLQLFHGYWRYHRSFPTQAVVRSNGDITQLKCHTFSTTACLSAKRRHTRSPPPPPQSTNTKKSLVSRDKAARSETSYKEGPPAAGKISQLTWRDYDPEGGMPLATGEYSKIQISTIFDDADLDADTGNYILSVMQWRRLSGALIDSGLDFPEQSRVGREQALKGLEHLRKLDPTFDEQGAGERWAEEEALRLQGEIQQRSIDLGIYKAEVEDPEAGQGTEYGRERSGESALQSHREEREAQWEQEQANKAAAEEREELAALHAQRGPLELAGGVQPSTAITTTGAGGIMVGQPLAKPWLLPVDQIRKPWVKHYEEQAQIIKTNELPGMSVLRRLGPSFLLMVAVVGLAIFISNNYTPPPKAARFFPDTPPAVATIGSITAVLATTFLLARFPPLWRTLSKYFTILPAYPNAFSLVGATVRHDRLGHLATNVISLWLFGLLLHEDVGRGTFLAIFFASGAVGGFTSLAYLVARKQWSAYVYGSSGCVLGVVAASCTLHPTARIKVLGYEVPIATWVFLALFGGAEAIAAIRGIKTTIDHAGHLGGLAAGIAAGLRLRSGREGNINGSGPRSNMGVGEVQLMRETKAP